MVDWARACGFTVVAAGKGTKYLPVYHHSTPDTVWSHYGFTEEQLAQGDFNAKMFNSFLDGTKSAIEMAAVANATGLVPPEDGLRFPPCGADDLPRILKPRAAGGLLDEAGQVEVVSSLERDGRPVYRDLRWGVFVTFTTDNRLLRPVFPRIRRRHRRERPVLGPLPAGPPDRPRTRHQRGLGGAPRRADRGGAGFHRRRRGHGKKGPASRGRSWTEKAASPSTEPSCRPADPSPPGISPSGSPMGSRSSKPVAAGEMVRWDDVTYDGQDETVKFRREMEALFKKEWSVR